MTASVYVRLASGDTTVVDAFTKAKAFWDEFFAAHAADDDEMLASALQANQVRFEWAVDDGSRDRPFMKEIMATTAFASLIDRELGGFDRNEELAKRLARAFQLSAVSGEVKTYAREAQEAFSIYPDE